MDVTYTDRAKQRGKDFPLLQEASRQLEKMVERSSGRVRAEWDRSEDEKGRPVYTLRISDGTHAAHAEFPPDYLKFSTYVPARLSQLWGDVLQALRRAAPQGPGTNRAA